MLFLYIRTGTLKKTPKSNIYFYQLNVSKITQKKNPRNYKTY